MAKRKNVSDRKVAEVVENHETIWRSAIVAASTTMSLCAPAIRGLHVVFTDRVPTMAVDKYFRCYVNPEFLDSCRKMASEVSASNPCTSCGSEKHHPIAYIGGVICHEAWHLLRSHHERAKNNDVLDGNLAYIWNVAADKEINDGLIEVFQNAPKVPNKLCLPPVQTEIDLPTKTGVLLPQSEGFEDGKLTEEYYNRLKVKQQEEEEKNKCPNCDGTGEDPGDKGDEEGDGAEGAGDGEGDEAGDGGGGGEGTEEGQGSGAGSKSCSSKGTGKPCPDCKGTGKNGGQFGKSGSGSGADGIERGYEDGEPGPDNASTGLSEVEARMIRKEVAKEIQEAVKNRGNLPGGWKMWADDELGVPKYNWKSELRKVLSRSMHTVPGDSLRSYRRLSRRSASLGHKVILPSHHNSTPHAAIVQDTSGSMGKDAIVASMEETKGFLKAIQTPITFINCDAAADKGQTVQNVRNIDMYGGGGTDMRVGIKAALDLRPPPDVIVLFTDGYTPWPEEPMPRGVQLIVCLVGHHACKVNEVPDFCKVVKIVDDLVEVG